MGSLPERRSMVVRGSAASAEQFMALFAGLDRVYGTYEVTGTREADGKQTGAASTKRAPLTAALWERHLSGEARLGVVPIRDGNDCVFGAIDVDQYAGLDHQKVAAKLARHGIPLLVCRTKSGGAHLYCFSQGAVPAAQMVSKLREVASFLGYGGSEVFPKQTKILSDQGDVGQWINMPYFGGTRGACYCVAPSGDALSEGEFLAAAEASRVGEAWFRELMVASGDFDDGPPCLQALSQMGIPEGMRNDGLFNIGVYLKKSRPDTWEKDLDVFNHKYMEPPLDMADVQGVAKSLRRKDYIYTCNKQPIAQHCNAVLCRTKRFGIGSSGSGRFPILGGLTKLSTSPPLWFWTVNEARIEFSTAEMQDPRKFQLKCMENLHAMPQVPAAPAWQSMVNHALENVTVVEAPADASNEGQFWELVEKFCTSRAQASTIDEILMGKPHTGEGRTYFRLRDLLDYLTRQKFFAFASPKIASMLKDAGGDHHFRVLKGRGSNFWSIPEVARQTEPHDVPREVSDGGSPF